MTNHPVAASAPGKVLFAGGFLVLDRAYRGLVFGLNARIHVHVREDESRTADSDTALPIAVHSPQFKDSRWLYTWRTEKCELEQVTTHSSYASRSNPFVQTALEYALIYLSHPSKDKALSTALQITILADDSYYSTSTGEQSGKFSDFGIALHEAHKTGLGSSAAIVTALTAALLVFLGLGSLFKDLADPTAKKRIHNLAQASHCAAQGKVGSGFDVAAAVYGSCLYRRFSPTILSDLESHSPGFGERLHRCVEDLNTYQAWDVEVSSKAVEIPKSLLLLMCDVDCGSETPGMVKKVLAWRKQKPEEASLLWNALQEGTEDLCRSLTALAAEVGITMGAQNKLSEIIQTIRALVRDMSAKSQVPIEPPVITELLDYCTGLPGVVGGVAPGAGGYDAVALLVRNDVDVVQDLANRLEGWRSARGEGPTIGKVSLLKVQQEWDGVKVEDLKKYESWVS